MSEADSLRHIALLHARGDLTAARREGEAALSRGAAGADLLHIVGVIACQTGDQPRGAALMRRALAARPDRLIRLNLARALLDLRELDEAAALCRIGEREEPIAGDFSRLRGDVLRAQGKPAEAIACYRRVVAANARDVEAWNNLGNAHHEIDELPEAIGALERARALRPQSATVHLNLGRVLATARRFEESLAALREAVRLAPDDATMLLELGRALNRLGRSAEALPLLGSAARLRRDDPQIFVAIGLTYGALADFRRSEEAHRMALRIDPGFAPAYTNLGILFEQSNRVDDIATLLRIAAGAGIDPRELCYIEALVLRRDGKFAAALTAARDAPDTTEPSLRAQLIGQLSDRLGAHDAAFEAFSEMNRHVAQDPLTAGLAPATYRQRIEALTTLTTRTWYDGWRPVAVTPDRAAPIFLIGFPRSGTTLLDTILMGHPQTRVLEEEPLLQRVRDMLPGMAAVAELDETRIAALRARYFAELDALAPDAADKLVIDKLPLNLLRTPLIARIFPDARFIFAQRHPCDVVLSCFMQNFRINQAMASFLTLEDSALLYDRVLGYWARCRTVFPLAVHDIRYEAMVADLEAQMRPLLAFLGLPWDDRILDHQRTAAGRGMIRTPSYAQVSEKIYVRARGRWEHYREHMRPILPILAPWVARMGYDPIDGGPDD